MSFVVDCHHQCEFHFLHDYRLVDPIVAQVIIWQSILSLAQNGYTVNTNEMKKRICQKAGIGRPLARYPRWYAGA